MQKPLPVSSCIFRHHRQILVIWQMTQFQYFLLEVPRQYLRQSYRPPMWPWPSSFSQHASLFNCGGHPILWDDRFIPSLRKGQSMCGTPIVMSCGKEDTQQGSLFTEEWRGTSRPMPRRKPWDPIQIHQGTQSVHTWNGPAIRSEL